MAEPAPPPPPEGSLADRAVDLAARGLLGGLLRLPYERRLAAAGALMRRAAGPLAGYRRRARANLALIHPDWPEARRRAVADAALDCLGRTVIENYGWPDFRERLRGRPPTGPGLAAIQEAGAAGRPVILLTGHFGNHMAAIHHLTLRGHRVGGLYRAMDNAFVDAHYAATMRDLSGPSFAKGKRGNLGFVRHLAGGGVGMILFDLHEASGVPIPFLGRPASTATTAADLAIRLGAALVPCWGTRTADGLDVDTAFEAPIPAGDPVAMMTEATRRLEARVAAHPGQWFWVHRRWKGGAADPVSPAAPPPGSAPARPPDPPPEG